jgi:hypothetical protein
MTTYKEIFGKPIKVLNSDPTDAGAEGQIWYNSTLGSFRSVVASGAWSSASPMTNARNSLGGAGTQTSAVIFGGAPALNTTEEYNGSGFSAGGNLNTGRSDLAGCGTQTAGLGFGGYTTAPNSQGQALTEEYNGSSWTVGGTLNTSRYGAAGAGTQTAGLAFGGYNNGLPPGNVTTATEEYNGSSWTTSPGTMGTARYEFAGAGLQTAAIAALGYDFGSPTRTTATEEYDGSSWTAGGNANTERSSCKGGGIQTSFLVFGGYASPTLLTATEAYNGTSWSNQPNLATARTRMGAASNTPGSPTGLCAGGQTPSATTATEEFNFTVNTVVPATWSSGGNLNAARFKMEMNGTQTATIAMGGGTMPSPPSSTTNSEYYDGSSWTAQPAMNNSRQRGGAGAFGTQTAAMSVSGVRTPPAPSNTVTDTEEWNGSNWTSGGAVPSGRYSACFFGTQTAGVFAGGNPGPSNTGATDSAEYNGSSFSSGNAMANARYNATSGGTLTAGLVVMGTAGGSDTATCEEYDGTNYSAGGTSVIADNDLGGSGTQTNFSAFIGPTAQTLIYDGTSWRTDVTGATALGNVAGTGTSSTTGIVASGNPGTGTTLEYNVGTTALNYETVSSS